MTRQAKGDSQFEISDPRSVEEMLLCCGTWVSARVPGLYSGMIVVTNRKLCKEDFLVRIEKIAALQPQAIILREKDLKEEEYERLARHAAIFAKGGLHAGFKFFY